MANRSSFVADSNQKLSRQQAAPKKTKTDFPRDNDRFEHKASSFKRREKYNNWQHQTYDDDYDDE